MDLIQLKYFRITAQFQSMTKAAEKLLVAQPAVSKVIKNLETELGYQLFDRVGKHIILNDNGKILLKYIDSIFNSIDDCTRELKDRNKKQLQTVSILVMAGSKLFPDIMARFTAAYPEVQFKIWQQPPEEQCDIYIYSTADTPPQDNAYTMLQERIMLAVPECHRLSRRDNISIPEIMDEDFIALEKGKNLRDHTDTLCALWNFTPRHILESDNPSLIREMLGCGLGVAFMPEISWGRVDGLPIRRLKIEDSRFVRDIYISWNHGRYLSKAARIFRDFVIGYYENLELPD